MGYQALLIQPRAGGVVGVGFLSPQKLNPRPESPHTHFKEEIPSTSTVLTSAAEFPHYRRHHHLEISMQYSLFKKKKKQPPFFHMA